MRKDMAKVVTEAPRRGHASPSRKWGRRLTRNEYGLDDHGPIRAPMARHRQYGWNAKEFSDVLGPLRRYLREVEQETWIGENGRVYRKRQWGPIEPVSGLYVHPTTGMLRFQPERRFGCRHTPFLRAQAALREFGVAADTSHAVRRYRIDGLHLWEHRDGGWFVHTYRHVPGQVVRVIARSDGREVPIYSPAHRERFATKQASKKEIRDAWPLLVRDPLARNR